jgi:hypothetical protein
LYFLSYVLSVGICHLSESRYQAVCFYPSPDCVMYNVVDTANFYETWLDIYATGDVSFFFFFLQNNKNLKYEEDSVRCHHEMCILSS